jgi:hypothetical protein
MLANMLLSALFVMRMVFYEYCSSGRVEQLRTTEGCFYYSKGVCKHMLSCFLESDLPVLDAGEYSDDPTGHITGSRPPDSILDASFFWYDPIS